MPSVFTQVRLQQLRAGDRVHYKGIPWAVKDFSTYADRDGEYATMEWLLVANNREIYLLREVDGASGHEVHDKSQNVTLCDGEHLSQNLNQELINQELNNAKLKQDMTAAGQNLPQSPMGTDVPEAFQINHQQLEHKQHEKLPNPKSQIRWYVSSELRLEQVLVEPSGDDLRYSLWTSRQQDGKNSLEPYPQLMALGELYYFADETQGIYQGEEGSLKRCTWDYWNRDHSLNLALEFWANDEVHVYSTTPVSPEMFSDIETNEVAQATGVSTISQKGERAWQWIAAWSMVIVGVFLMLFGGW